MATGRCGRSAATSAIRRPKPLASMVMNTSAISSRTSVLAASVRLASRPVAIPDDLPVVDLRDEVGELAGDQPGVVEVGDHRVDQVLGGFGVVGQQRGHLRDRDDQQGDEPQRTVQTSRSSTVVASHRGTPEPSQPALAPG